MFVVLVEVRLRAFLMSIIVSFFGCCSYLKSRLSPHWSEQCGGSRNGSSGWIVEEKIASEERELIPGHPACIQSP